MALFTLSSNATVSQVPVRADFPWYFFKITVSNVIYTLRFRFNTRMSRWIMDIADASNNDLLNGIPILIARNLNGQYVITGLPPGFFFALDKTNKLTQATLYSFGVTHALFYYDPLGVT